MRHWATCRMYKIWVFWEAINAKDVWPDTGRWTCWEADTTANYIHRIMNQNWHQLWVIRLRRAGHVQCKAAQQKPKRLLHAKITWRRKVGRPKSRWSAVVNGDTRKLKIKCGKEELLTETGGKHSNWKPRLFVSCRAMMIISLQNINQRAFVIETQCFLWSRNCKFKCIHTNFKQCYDPSGIGAAMQRNAFLRFLKFFLRRLVADLSSMGSGFETRPVHVGSVLDRVALGQVFLPVFRFSPDS